MRAKRRSISLALMKRAVEKGELSPDAPAALMVEVLYATLITRMYSEGDLSHDGVAALVRLVLHGGLRTG